MNPIAENRKILIIEDDAKHRDSIISLFEDTHYLFLEASTVREGLDLSKKHPDVQVVILDLKLRAGTGTDFLEGIKERVASYRVIILTAHDELLQAKRAESYQVFSYVAKTGKSLRETLRFQVERAFADIEKAWLGKKVDVHLEIVRRVNHLGLDPNHNADLELKEVLDLICDHALDLVDAYTCHIRLLDPGRDDYVLWASRGRIQNAGRIFNERVPLNKAYSGIVAETRERIIIDNLQTEQEFTDMKEEALKEGMVDPGGREYLDNVRSAYIAPISTGIFGEGIDAVFNINSDVEKFFSTEERQALVDDFVTQTALAITKHLLKKKRIEIHADYRNIGDMLAEISNIFIAGENDLDKIYKIVFKRISDGLKPEIISIFLFDEASKQLKNVAECRADKWVGPVDEQYCSGIGVVGKVYSAGRAQRFVNKQDILSGQMEDNYLPEGYAEESIRNIPSGRLRHYLGVPIKFGNDTIGVIRTVNKRSDQYDSEKDKTNSLSLLKRGFSEDCQTELEIAANHLAATIKNAELIGELNKTVKQLESLYAVGHMISSEMDMNALFNRIVGSAAEVMHAEICMLFLKNEVGDQVVLTQSFGMPLIKNAFYKLGGGKSDGKTAWVAETGNYILEGQAISSHKGKYDEHIVAFLRDKHKDDSKGIESFMAVPIRAKGRILGVIKVINKVESPFQFDKKDLNLFQLFASQIGLERFLYTKRYVENIIDNSPEPIIFLDANGRIEVFNRACEQLWGYKSQEAIGRSVVDFYISTKQARAIGRELWESADHRIHNVDAYIKDKDGVIIPVRLSAALLFDEDIMIGSMGVFKDLREIKQLEDQMLRAEREAVVGKLAQTIGHDIKHNIGTVLNYIEPLMYECNEKEQKELYQIYTDMQEALQEAITKLKNVFDGVQPTPPQKKDVRLEDIFNENIGSSMRRVADRKNVDFVLKYSDEEHEMSVDVSQINEVLWNLFDNSLDAIGKKKANGMLDGRGCIEVSAYIKDHNLELTWKDNGCGIPKEKIPIIFQALYTDKPNGTGLGLHILKNNIEGHGGHVSVESVEGEGSTFNVTIPVSTDRTSGGEE
jgi:PAS domain S-box-containing protein